MAASSSARPTVEAVTETPTPATRPGEVPVLVVTDLTVDFPTDDGLVHAVRGVSYSVSAGEVLAIVGESGSGKSVSSLALMGLLPKTAKIGGSARYRGTDLLSLSDREMSRIRGGRVAMIFQDPMTSLNPVYTIGHQLAEGVRAHNDVSKKAAFARARDLLGIVGIPNPEQRSEYYPHEFSGGMRQRVVIAMAMANDPEIIIADEPTTALDVTVQAQIMETLAKAQEETGAAIVLITHDLGVVAGVADSVLVMYAGRPVEIGSVDDIYYSARMPYTVGLLGSIPRVDGSERERLVPIKGSPPSLIALPPGCPFGPRCPLHRDVCDTAEPPLLVVAGLAHSAACYFSDELSAETVAEELFATDSVDDADPAGERATGVEPPAVAPTPTGALPVDDAAPASPEVTEGRVGGSPRSQRPRIGARRRP